MEFENLYKPSDFARSIGITRQAVSKNIKSGLLPSVEYEGKIYIDISDQNVISYIENNSYEFTEKSGNVIKPKTHKTIKLVEGKKTKSTENKSYVKVKSKKQPESSNESNIPDYLKEYAQSEHLSFTQIMSLAKVEIDKIRIYETIKKVRVERKQKEGELVERKLVEKVFGKIYDIDVNQLLASKTKISAQMASLFGCTDIDKIMIAEEKIEDELYRVLISVKDEINKFLISIECDEISGP